MRPLFPGGLTLVVSQSKETIRERFAGRKATPDRIDELLYEAVKLEERVAELEKENAALRESLRAANDAAWSKRR